MNKAIVKNLQGKIEYFDRRSDFHFEKSVRHAEPTNPEFSEELAGWNLGKAQAYQDAIMQIKMLLEGEV